MYIWDAQGTQVPRRTRRAVRRPGGSRSRGAGRGRRQAGQGAVVLPAVDVRAPARHPAGRAHRVVRAGRPQPRVLHDRWRRGRRDGVEARQAVLQADRQADQDQGHQPPGRLPRHAARRPVDHRHPGHEGDVRAARAVDVARAQHQLLPRARSTATTREAFGRWAANRIEDAILAEGADTVAAVFLEPVQNAGGCFPPPPGYFERVREICDEHDVLLVSDEVICAFGRLGEMFGATQVRLPARHDHVRQGPDVRLLAARRDDRVRPPDGAVPARATQSFAHGYTFGGHPVSAAVAMANLDIFEREDLNGHVLRNEGAFRSTLEKLLDLDMVGDVRGDGFFYGIELVKDKATKETFDDDGVREAAARVPVEGAVRQRPVLPRRRPRRPGHPAGSPADRRPVALRRDRADPALRADRGPEPDLTLARTVPQVPGAALLTPFAAVTWQISSPAASLPGRARFTTVPW